MKKLLIISAIVLSSPYFGVAQEKRFEEAMYKTLALLDSAKDMESWQQVANRFERIAHAEKTQWLPYYWSAYCYIIINYNEPKKNRKDDWLDKAQELTDKADSIDPKNAEIYVMKGWILSARIPVNPMSRGSKYGPRSSSMLTAAHALDPENPRYYYLEGSNKYYTPAMFGGGKDKAIPLLEKAMEKYKTFKPASALHPNWGEPRAKAMLEKCREQ